MNGGLDVAAFIALLAGAVVISIAAERIAVPAAALLVAIGAACGSFWHVRPPFDFGPALLFVFLPPLVFEAAWRLDLDALRPHAGKVVFLALPGTLLCAFAIAGALLAARALPFSAALLFGAMVAATDPVAVVAVFRRLKIGAAAAAIFEAESLTNDGIALVLYTIALSAAMRAAPQVTAGAWVAASLHGIAAVTGGVAIGVACALPLWLVLRATSTSEYEVTATVALAYSAYLAADRAGLSGIFATMSAAIALRALLRRRPHLAHRDDVDTVWNALASIVNAIVFLSAGLSIDVPRALHEPLLVAVALAAILLSRAALASVAFGDRRSRIAALLAGMRGALPLALALSLPAAVPHRPVLIDAVFATVLVTLVLQGAALGVAFGGTRRAPRSTADTPSAR